MSENMRKDQEAPLKTKLCTKNQLDDENFDIIEHSSEIVSDLSHHELQQKVMTTEELRNTVQVQALVEMLQASILNSRSKSLTPNRIAAIKLLLSKVLPDLKAVEQNINVDGRITTCIEVTFVNAASPVKLKAPLNVN